MAALGLVICGTATTVRVVEPEMFPLLSVQEIVVVPAETPVAMLNPETLVEPRDATAGAELSQVEPEVLSRVLPSFNVARQLNV